MRYVMGDYGGKAPTEMLMQQQFSQIPTDVADLRGKRFVVAAEVEEGKRWAESRIKDLTGGDMIKARRMREDFFEFPQTHKLWVFGNHKPVLRGTDEGIKRRMRIIPFIAQITDEERIPLTRMLAMLRDEGPGILNWMLEGYLKWCESGLNMPSKVQEATQLYFEDNDILQQFIDECCSVNRQYTIDGQSLWKTDLPPLYVPDPELVLMPLL
jgi:putative DNA primase/helicase